MVSARLSSSRHSVPPARSRLIPQAQVAKHSESAFRKSVWEKTLYWADFSLAVRPRRRACPLLGFPLIAKAGGVEGQIPLASR